MRRVERWRRRGWSRGRIAAAAEDLAGRLHADGVEEGDRVGVHVQDGPLWIAAFFGVLRCGGVAVPVDVAHPPELVRELAGELDLAAWVTESELPRVDVGLRRFELDWRGAPEPGPGQAGRRRGPGRSPATPARSPDSASGSPPPAPWPDDDPDRLAQVVLTSGTTSRPRPVEVTHRNLRTVLDGLGGEIDEYRWAIRVAPRLRLAVTLPFSHLYGQMMGVFLPPLLEADVAAVATLPAPELARALRREGAWVLAAVPHGLESLAGHLLARGRERWGDRGLDERMEANEGRPWPLRWLAFDPLRRRLGRRLVAVVSGGAALDADLEARWRRLGYLVVQGYGLTEAAPIVTLNHPFRPAEGSIGKPLPGVEVRLAEDDEILVRGGNVARPAAEGPRVDEDGWLHTGDLGRRGPDGTIRFVGRKSDRIVTPAGVNVDPDDVVAELRREAGIADAAVLERPWGEAGVVSAVLVLRPGGYADAAVRSANARLPDAARVRDWHVWPRGDLPRTPTGKPRRGELVSWLLRKSGRGETDGERGETPGSRVEAPLGAGSGNAAGAEASGRASEAGTHGDADVRAVVERVLELTRRREAGARQEPGTSRGPRRLSSDTTLGEALTSLQRVEMAAALEDVLDVSLGDPVFDADRTLEELARELVDVRGPGQGRREPEERRGEPEPGRGPAVGPGRRGQREEPRPGAGGAGPEAEGSRPGAEEARPGSRQRPPDAEEAPATPRTAAAADGESGARRRGSAPPDPTWRHWPPTRLARWLLRETVMRPLAALFVRLDVVGAGVFEEIAAPFVLAANHVSMMDPVVLFALPRDVRAGLAPAARWNWFTERRSGGLWYRIGVLGMNLVPLLQSGDWRWSLRIAGRIADRGGCILIYPEGAISSDGEPGSFQPGVALISRELHLPIVPVATAGLHDVLPRGFRWPRRGLRRPRVGVRFGEPLPPVRPGDEVGEVTRDLEERVRRLNREARDAVDELG